MKAKASCVRDYPRSAAERLGGHCRAHAARALGFHRHLGARRLAPEPAALNGIAHFIEHMVFKGTSRRTAEQIAREMDSVGGMLDAFTSKESVCFNAKVLDEHLPAGF